VFREAADAHGGEERGHAREGEPGMGSAGGKGVGKGREDKRKVGQGRHDEWQGRAGRDDTVGEGCRTMGEHDAPLLKHLHIIEDVRQYKTEQRPQLCEVILWGGGRQCPYFYRTRKKIPTCNGVPASTIRPALL
jgi:hypothetical protein